MLEEKYMEAGDQAQETERVHLEQLEHYQNSIVEHEIFHEKMEAFTNLLRTEMQEQGEAAESARSDMMAHLEFELEEKNRKMSEVVFKMDATSNEIQDELKSEMLYYEEQEELHMATQHETYEKDELAAQNTRRLIESEEKEESYRLHAKQFECDALALRRELETKSRQEKEVAEKMRYIRS